MFSCHQILFPIFIIFSLFTIISSKQSKSTKSQIKTIINTETDEKYLYDEYRGLFADNQENEPNKSSEEDAVNAYYAIDPHKARQLAKLEQEIVATLSSEILPTTQIDPTLFLEEGNLCYETFLKYYTEYQEDTEAIKLFLERRYGVKYKVKSESVVADVSKRSKIVSENPNLLFRLIRRMVKILLDEMLTFCSKNYEDMWVIETLEEMFDFSKLPYPTENDLDDALEGLLRIHFIYGLNATSELRLGIFNGVNTNAILGFDDCLALAEKAIEMETEIMAYQWLMSAHLSIPPDELPMSKLTTKLLENQWKKLMVSTNFKTMKQLHLNLGNKQQQIAKSSLHFDDYEPCRIEWGHVIPEVSKNLACYYTNHKWHPYFAINPVKYEILSDGPLIVQFYEFVGKKAIRAIQSSIAYEPIRAETVNYGPAEKGKFRTSMNTFVFDAEENDPPPILRKLNQRIEVLLDLNVVKAAASNMQVAVYGALGGHYDFHHDAFMKDTPDHLKNPFEGNRVATFLMFLNNVAMGGYTAFLDADVAAKPIKGSAVMWYNTRRNGEVEINTYHGGCPVILGQKQIANRWIMEYENMFKRPCTLNPDR